MNNNLEDPKLSFINYQKWVFNSQNSWKGVTFDDLKPEESIKMLCEWEREFQKEHLENTRRFY